RLESCIDSASSLDPRALVDGCGDDMPEDERVAGITTWDPEQPLIAQATASGKLHGRAGQGTAVVLINETRLPTAAELAELLHFAWRRTNMVRLRFLRAQSALRQLRAPWESSSESP